MIRVISDIVPCSTIRSIVVDRQYMSLLARIVKDPGQPHEPSVCTREAEAHCIKVECSMEVSVLVDQNNDINTSEQTKRSCRHRIWRVKG